MRKRTKQDIFFRQTEVERILHLIKAGESASIVGVSGMGKSNLFNHLLDPDTLDHYMGEDAAGQYLFIRVNFHYIPEYSDRGVYSLILEELEQPKNRGGVKFSDELTKTITNYHDHLLNTGPDKLKLQRYFKLALREVVSETKRKIVFLFDQFDDVYVEIESRLFHNLRGLRESYKYSLMYIIFTRDTLDNLAPASLDAIHEEFYELMAANVIGLKPYNKLDATAMLTRIAQRLQETIPDGRIEQLYELTGGHAGLLRASYLATLKNKNSNIDTLLQDRNVRLECEKLWYSIGIDEQQVVTSLAHGPSTVQAEPSQTETHQFARERLQLKGLLLGNEIFSLLFRNYLKAVKTPWAEAIICDERNKQVWLLNRSIKFTPTEFRLFDILQENVNQIVTKDELSNAGWPENNGDVSDGMITTNIRRLRKKFKKHQLNQVTIENVHGEGYLLKIPPELLQAKT